MANQLKYIVGLLLISMVVGFHVQYKGMNIFSQWMKSPRSSSLTSSTTRMMIKSSTFSQSTMPKYHISNMALAETVAPVETTTPVTTGAGGVDFSTYAPGQEYQAKLVAAKKFGVFADIGNGQTVLLPRSVLGNSYEKLRKMIDDKSEEKVRVEIMSVSAANRTLSGKYVGNYKARPDLSSLNAKELETKQFVATVVSAHDFGVFAEIDELGVEGLIPISKLPEGSSKTTVKSSFK
jgi:predicted RNA-binding protein with RPS1 domain